MLFDLAGNLKFSVHGGGDAVVAVFEILSHLLTTLEHLMTLSPRQAFFELMPGITSLQNFHPLFVHFPIVLLGLFFLIELIAVLFKRNDWRAVASGFLYLGTLSTVVTVLTGLKAAASVAHDEVVHEIMESHEHLGIGVLILAILLSSWRSLARTSLHGMMSFVFILFASLLAALVSLGADLGGLMVYQHGVSVAAVSVEQNQVGEAHQHAEDGAHHH